MFLSIIHFNPFVEFLVLELIIGRRNCLVGGQLVGWYVFDWSFLLWKPSVTVLSKSLVKTAADLFIDTLF